MTHAEMDQPAPAAGERPLWRKIADFPLVVMVVAVAILVVAVTLAGFIAGQLMPNAEPVNRVIVQDLLAIVTMVAAYKLFIRHLGRYKHDDLALDGSIKETLAGLGIGGGLMALAVAVAAILGVYVVIGRGDTSQLLPALVLAGLFPAVSEELLFRGILFRWIEEFGGTWLALALTSALFGAAHLMNPNSSLVAAAAIALEAGVMLGAAYMVTRRLWLAMGIHASWNFAQGEIFDIPVSGTPAHGLVEAELRGHPLLSGAGFGLEASVIALVIATAFGIYLLRRAIRDGQLVRPMWVKGRTIPYAKRTAE